MWNWRTSTWVWIFAAIAAFVAEFIYATNENYSDLQGHALALLIVVSVILAVYRGVTVDKHGASKLCPDCAEKVQPAARVCRHCGHRFDAADEAA